MITKKLMVAVLCTFCLTAALLSAVPVESAATYDPWVDVNHDGKINVLDLIKVAVGVGSSGNPSLNVTVANFPSGFDTLVWFNTLVNNTTLFSPVYDAKGYGHLNIMGGVDVAGSDTVTVFFIGAIWNAQHNGFTPMLVYSQVLTYSSNRIIVNLPVPSTSFYFYAYANSATNHHIWLNYYSTWT